MLHQSVLPVHRSFSRLLAQLKYVVVDEGHAYRVGAGQAERAPSCAVSGQG